MDFGRIIQMVINTVLRRGVNMAVNKGIGLASKGKQKARPGAAADAPDQSATARDTVKRARQAARVTRRLGR